MKRIFLLVVLCVIAFVGRSQDVIVLNNGKEIKSKIIESNNENVKFNIFSENDKQICKVRKKIKEYKKQNLSIVQQEFSVAKKEVFMIQYENGKNEILKEKVSNAVTTNMLNFIDVNNNPEAYKIYRNAYKKFSLSKGLVGAGGGLFAYGVIALIVSSTDGVKDNTNLGASYIYMGAGTVFMAAGLPLYFSSKSKMNKAFKMYTSATQTSFDQNNVRFKLGGTESGFGLSLNF